MIAQIQCEGITIDIHRMNTIIVGSGAASLNAAHVLFEQGQKDIALVTEGLKMGTSRNTGSDKQTYYKLSTCGYEEDSIHNMAQTLFQGGAMHGDIALVESALSTRAFFKLVEIGVPFPHDEYGQYVGYKTDHDAYTRASSVGPLTSKIMTEKLEEQVASKGIKIYDGYQVIQILTNKDKTRALGVLAINKKALNEKDYGLTLFNCRNIIYGTGGPASIYFNSVYPKSQSGSTGIALEAGVKGVNLTEWQYGLASTKFRWNVSGSYQQVIPRYVSTNEDMEDEKEFLMDYFMDYGKMINAIFMKGYQWPFDPRKLKDKSSSVIDVLVYEETQIKGRRVFLDFTKNPLSQSAHHGLVYNALHKEAYTYLKNSSALCQIPIERLEKMNPLAIELYKRHGIDISKEYLEIDVCAQHHNGGLMGNIWWESNVKHFFPVGEVCGSLGVYRPGGSALNSTQVGSYRAAIYIHQEYGGEAPSNNDFFQMVKEQLSNRINLIKRFNWCSENESTVKMKQEYYQKRMSKVGAFIREYTAIDKALKETEEEFRQFCQQNIMKSMTELDDVFKNYDLLITQMAILGAIKEYIQKGGPSRGSYLICDDQGQDSIKLMNREVIYSLNDDFYSKTCETMVQIKDNSIKLEHNWKNVRPIPRPDLWFEKVWEKHRKKEIYTS